MAGRVLAARPGEGDGREERHGRGRRRHQRRRARDGERRTARPPTTPAHVARSGRRQRAAHRPVRAGLDEQAHHAVVGARARARHARHEVRRAVLASGSIRTSQPYYDAEPHVGVPNGIEHWTTADILRESSNVGTIEIAQTHAATRRSPTALRAFGLGEQTAIEWPDQPAGLVDPAVAVLRDRASTRPRSATASRSPACRCSTRSRRSRTAA